jgi:hypothetical protein
MVLRVQWLIRQVVKTSYVNNRKANFAGEYASSANWSRTAQWLWKCGLLIGGFL